MKFVVLACLAAVALAAPQVSVSELRAVPIIRNDHVDDGAGRFSYSYETGNGIVANAEGTPGVEGQSNIEGTYRFPLGNGQFLEVSYVADERGYRPSTRFVGNRK